MPAAWGSLSSAIGGLTSLLVNLLYVSILYFSGYLCGSWKTIKRAKAKNDPLFINEQEEQQQAQIETISEEVYKSAWLHLAPTNRTGSASSDGASSAESRSLSERLDGSSPSTHSSSITRSTSSLSIGSQTRGTEKLSSICGRYFVVLKNQNLFIYSSEQQTNCLAALCLEDCHVELDDLEGQLEPAELFGPAYLLSISTKRGTLFGPYASLTLKFETGMQKEDWFYALRRAVQLSNSLMMKEMDRWVGEVRKYFRTLKRNTSSVLGGSKPAVSHSREPSTGSLNESLQVINLLVGRIFFNIYESGLIEQQIISKFKRKLEISPLPTFLEGISISEILLSKQPPLLSHVQLHRCTDMGDLSFFGTLFLASELSIVLEGKVVSEALPLVKRLKKFTLPITVRATIRSMKGRALVHLKRPPSDRIWFGFLEKPVIDLQLEPVIASTAVSISMILEFLEDCAIDAINSSVVYPSMEDVAMIPRYESTQFPFVCQCLDAYSTTGLGKEDLSGAAAVSPFIRLKTSKSITSSDHYVPPLPPNTTNSSPSESFSMEGQSADKSGETSSSHQSLALISNFSQTFVSSSTSSLMEETNYAFIPKPKSALTKRPRSSSHNSNL